VEDLRRCEQAAMRLTVRTMHTSDCCFEDALHATVGTLDA